jgi:hypothetical protein
VKIRKDLKAFVQALNNEEVICGTSSGKWYFGGLGTRAIRKLSQNFESCRLAKVGYAFNTCLDQLEKIPIKFNTSHQLLQGQELSEFLQAAEVVKKVLNEHKGHPKVKKQLDFLDQRIIGLKYRMEKCNGGLDRAVILNEHVESLKAEAIAWKKEQDLYEIKVLLPEEEVKIIQACEYPEFLKLLLSNPLLRLTFFKWALRDNNPVNVFVQFPSTCKLLKTCLFSGRIGRFTKECLSVVHKNCSEGTKKIATLPFEIQTDNGLEKKNINILKDKKEVVLRGNYKITMKEIFEEFKAKNERPSKFEFYEGKISNFNSFELGWWNPQKNDYERIDLSEKKITWWKGLPVFETLSEQELQVRYGIEELKKDEWVAIVNSTRESASLNIHNSHGYLEIAIPNEKGEYNIYPLGRFPARFPNTFIQKIFFLADTTEARVSYPDENVFYSHRQHAYKPFVISPEKGGKLMEALKADLLQAERGDSVFQFCGENCAYWIQKLLKDLFNARGDPSVLDLFECHILKAELRVWPINNFIKFVKELPEKIKTVRKIMPKKVRTFTKHLSIKLQRICLRIAEFFLSSWRGRWVRENGKDVWKSISTSSFRDNYRIFHPAYLHHRIIKNKFFGGKVTMGHMFANQLAF